DRSVVLARRAYQTTNVIGMLVRHQNRVELIEIFPYRGQPRSQLAPAQSRINQQTRTPSGQKRRVAGAAARQNADLNDKSSSGGCGGLFIRVGQAATEVQQNVSDPFR